MANAKLLRRQAEAVAVAPRSVRKPLDEEIVGRICILQEAWEKQNYKALAFDYAIEGARETQKAEVFCFDRRTNGLRR